MERVLLQMRKAECEISVMIICVTVVSISLFFFFYFFFHIPSWTGHTRWVKWFFAPETVVRIVRHQSGSWGKAQFWVWINWRLLCFFCWSDWCMGWSKDIFYSFIDLIHTRAWSYLWEYKHLCVVMWNSRKQEMVLEIGGFSVVLFQFCNRSMISESCFGVKVQIKYLNCFMNLLLKMSFDFLTFSYISKTRDT